MLKNHAVAVQIMGVARIFQRGGHTDSNRGYSSDCHQNIVGCLLTKRLTKGGSREPQDPPLATPLVQMQDQTTYLWLIEVKIMLLALKKPSRLGQHEENTAQTGI